MHYNLCLFTLFQCLMCGCTSLGPMAAITLSNPLPSDRPTAEIRAGLAPGFFLSSVVSDKGPSPLPQIAGELDIGHWLGFKGIAIGGRVVGGGDSTPIVEPIIQYRTHLGGKKRFALGLAGFGAYATGEAAGATYRARRLGFEVAGDVRLTPSFKWIELHVQTGISLTGISASGVYCAHYGGQPKTCGPSSVIDGQQTIFQTNFIGVFPTLFAASVLHLFHGHSSYFHGFELGLYVATGMMPHIIGSERQDDRPWDMMGAQFAMSFGSESKN